jgi:thiosulfate/3-mercaptopyruvate sulfurtransferase
MYAHRRLIAAALALSITTAPSTATAQRSPRAELTVSSAWLAEHLKDPDLVLLHVGEKPEYDKAHLPGARFITMQDFAVSSRDREKGLVLELPTADTLRARLAAFGISDNSRIIVYYGNDWVSPSTRLVLTLDHAGLGPRTSLLDGGMNAWKAENRPTTADVAPAKVGKLSPLKTKPVTVTIDFVQSHLNTPGFKVVDARSASFYDGVQEADGRKGHIAGAGSVPFDATFDDKNHLKSAGELEALFARAGVGPKDTIIAYCHIGQQATAVVFAARTLGRNVLLFDGSFQEWGRRTDLPVELPKP